MVVTDIELDPHVCVSSVRWRVEGCRQVSRAFEQPRKLGVERQCAPHDTDDSSPGGIEVRYPGGSTPAIVGGDEGGVACEVQSDLGRTLLGLRRGELQNKAYQVILSAALGGIVLHEA